MKERERYENRDGIYDTIIDDYADTDILVNLLNQQDKRIKELEEQTYPAYKREHKRRAYLENIEVPRLEKENEQLKQELYELPKKIVEEIKNYLLDFSNGWWRHFMTDGCEYMLSSDLQGCLDETIDTILKSMEGKKMEKAICSECGSLVEIVDGEEWGYCPFCENDQVELKRKPKEMLENE